MWSLFRGLIRSEVGEEKKDQFWNAVETWYCDCGAPTERFLLSLNSVLSPHSFTPYPYARPGLTNKQFNKGKEVVVKEIIRIYCTLTDMLWESPNDQRL